VSRKTEDRASFLLLGSLLAYMLVGMFLEDDLLAEGFLLLSLFGMLLAVSFYLSVKKSWRWPGIIHAFALGALTTGVLFYKGFWLRVAFWTVMAAFFVFVIAGLIGHLGRPGAVTGGRLSIAVSLYILIGVFWFALYNLLETVYPGSFGQPGPEKRVAARSFLYFSMETLTTLGYGDILPLSPKARSLSVLEAAAGILFIAVAVSRLVASYQSELSDAEDQAP